MTYDDRQTSAQVRESASKTRTHASTPDPAASPLGTDGEAADNPASADRLDLAHEADRKIDAVAKRRKESPR